MYFPLCIYYREAFGWEIYVIASVAVTFGTMGVISFSRALKYGNAGPVQAIENAKAIVQTILTAIFVKQVPSILQILGLVAGLIGVTIIVIQKKESI